MAARAAKCLTWWRVSGGELGALLGALRELDAPPDGSPAALQRAQLAQLSDRAADAELRCAALQADADLLRTLAGGERSDPLRPEGMLALSVSVYLLHDFFEI